MKVIICVDDNGGIAFNRRRQSRDRVLSEEILKLVGEKTLFMSEYSSKLFEDKSKIKIDEEYWDRAGEEDYCFVERVDIIPYLERIREIVLVRWNRIYPADMYFKVPMKQFKYVKNKELKGSSHEKITVEIYEKATGD